MIYTPPGVIVAEQTFNKQDVLGLRIRLLINDKSGEEAVKFFRDDAVANKEPVEAFDELLKFPAAHNLEAMTEKKPELPKDPDAMKEKPAGDGHGGGKAGGQAEGSSD